MGIVSEYIWTYYLLVTTHFDGIKHMWGRQENHLYVLLVKIDCIPSGNGPLHLMDEYVSCCGATFSCARGWQHYASGYSRIFKESLDYR